MSAENKSLLTPEMDAWLKRLHPNLSSYKLSAIKSRLYQRAMKQLRERHRAEFDGLFNEQVRQHCIEMEDDS